jgi:stress response protein SCP2
MCGRPPGAADHARAAVPAATAQPAQLAELQRQARRQAAEEAFGALATLERHLTTLHLESFPATVAPPDLGPEPVDRAAMLAALESRELAGLGTFDFGGRREAKRRARAALDSAVEAEHAARAHHYQTQRTVELEAWHALAGNDPEAMVFYNQPVGADGAVRAAGRSQQPTIGSLTDRITIDLPRMPAAIHRIVIAASLDGSGAPTLTAVTGLRVAVATADETVAVFPLTGLSTEAAAVTAEIYRRDGTWRLRAVGQGWATGLAGLAHDYGIDIT